MKHTPDLIITRIDNLKNNKSSKIYLGNFSYTFNEILDQNIKISHSNNDLIREKLNKHPSLKNFKKYIHFGLTSEDINSTSYAQIINNAKEEYLEKILELKKILK